MFCFCSAGDVITLHSWLVGLFGVDLDYLFIYFKITKEEDFNQCEHFEGNPNKTNPLFTDSDFLSH